MGSDAHICPVLNPIRLPYHGSAKGYFAKPGAKQPFALQGMAPSTSFDGYSINTAYNITIPFERLRRDPPAFPISIACTGLSPG